MLVSCAVDPVITKVGTRRDDERVCRLIVSRCGHRRSCPFGGTRRYGRNVGLAGLFYDLVEFGQLVELDEVRGVGLLEYLGLYGGDGAHGDAEKPGYFLGVGAL